MKVGDKIRNNHSGKICTVLKIEKKELIFVVEEGEKFWTSEELFKISSFTNLSEERRLKLKNLSELAKNK